MKDEDQLATAYDRLSGVFVALALLQAEETGSDLSELRAGDGCDDA
jgi:hypothetical protein